MSKSNNKLVEQFPFPPQNKCNRQGCTNEGLWNVMLRVRAGAVYTKPFDYLQSTPFKVCLEHRFKDPEEYLEDPIWEQLAEGLRKQFNQEPCRELTTVEFQQRTEDGKWLTGKKRAAPTSGNRKSKQIDPAILAAQPQGVAGSAPPIKKGSRPSPKERDSIARNVESSTGSNEEVKN